MSDISDRRTSPAATLSKAEPAGRVWTERGTPSYRKISLALFLAGFATFSLIYCVQTFLPALATEFSVSAAQSSLALSATTAMLAIGILAASMVSESLGRRGLMFWAILSAAVLNIAAAASRDWSVLLVARGLEGFVLGGVPAVAMAYLAEEIHPGGLGYTMGLYVAGTAFGGMFGRVGVGILTELCSWRLALGALGLLDLAAALGFIILLPPSRNFTRRAALDLHYHLEAWRLHLGHGGLPFLFIIGGLVMGAFVTVYNYSDFRLVAPPYSLKEGAISTIFLVYILGMAASPAAGVLADRIGRGKVLLTGIFIAGAGIALTLLHPLGTIFAGIACLTVGFFMAHSVASGWVGHFARQAKGHASALYLLSYYLGSSVMGSLGGLFWSWRGWPAVVAFAGFLLVLAAAAGLLLSLRFDHPLQAGGKIPADLSIPGQ